MESFTRAVEIVLKERGTLDTSSIPYDAERMMNEATPIELSDEQCSELERRARSQTIDARAERECPN